MMEMRMFYPLMWICLLVPPVAGTFSCTMKFTVRDCDPNTGVPDEDGYDDEYVVRLPCRPCISTASATALTEHFPRTAARTHGI